jgi:fucose permease
MNLLHMSFGVGALAAPLVVGTLVAAGIPWQAVMIGTGAVVLLLAVAYVLVPTPSGRRSTAARPTEPPAAEAGATSSGAGAAYVSGGPATRGLLAGPLLLLGLAIAAYVASEVGVSNWLVRFLADAPLTTATLALSLYWAGLTAGRLVSSVIADRFDHLRFTIACALGMAVLVAMAVLAPTLPLSIAAFTAAGIASGPVFPMIVAIGGERYPDRSAAVGGSLTGLAVVGATLYPPAMGFLSVSVGLTVAMLGNVVLGLACALALGAFATVVPRGSAQPSLSRAPHRAPRR